MFSMLIKYSFKSLIVLVQPPQAVPIYVSVMDFSWKIFPVFDFRMVSFFGNRRDLELLSSKCIQSCSSWDVGTSHTHTFLHIYVHVPLDFLSTFVYRDSVYRFWSEEGERGCCMREWVCGVENRQDIPFQNFKKVLPTTKGFVGGGWLIVFLKASY